MNILTLIIILACANPNNYEKFKTKNSTEGLERLTCEKELKGCYAFTGNINHCLEQLRDL